jgi:hypothetical protein
MTHSVSLSAQPFRSSADRSLILGTLGIIGTLECEGGRGPCLGSYEAYSHRRGLYHKDFDCPRIEKAQRTMSAYCNDVVCKVLYKLVSPTASPLRL